jgi:hypothetical protein
LPTGEKEYVRKEVTMAWVSERSGTRGTRYAGIYRDPDGQKRSAGTYPSRREALRAANREEQKVLSGTWHDGSLGQITFRDLRRRGVASPQAPRGHHPCRVQLIPE